ncbi:hypothetical protein GCM10007858_62750 [Bradyrhizobium liaoningense]|nr:hypothetical protein GCM10007858_62750 [Bradyrhizobium liaoningense]
MGGIESPLPPVTALPGAIAWNARTTGNRVVQFDVRDKRNNQIEDVVLVQVRSDSRRTRRQKASPLQSPGDPGASRAREF